MKLKNISIRFFTSLMSVAVVMFGGCSDDPFVSPDFTVSGEATTVTFELSVPQMTQVTRAARRGGPRTVVARIAEKRR